jgi:Zn-dependent peptidase ImmA (M78 family)
MTTNVNPKLVVLARELRGITQKELAQKVSNLTQGNLSRMEKGLLNIPEDTINLISEELNLPVKFFFQEDIKNHFSNFYYRKRISLPKKTLQISDAKMQVISNCVDNLLNSIELDSPELPKIRVDGQLKQPDDIARIARKFFNIGNGPINNLTEVIEKKGIMIIEIDFESDKFDGITLITKKLQPIIFINSNIPNDRKRFTLSHELGHAIMHLPFELDLDISEKELEREANLFAAEFLMPEIDIRRDLSHLTYSKLSSIKEYWMTSKISIIYRAHQLGSIGEDKYKYLLIELSRQGERRKERVEVQFQGPSLVNNIIDFFKSELNYSVLELCEYLSISMKDFQNFFTASDNVKLRVVR